MEGESGPYSEVTGKALLKHAEKYAAALAGEAAVKARPIAAVAPTRMEELGVDAAVDGACAYTPEEQKRTGYDGEYFLIMNRGYRNVVVAAVAFKPFTREKAAAEGPALLKGLNYY